MSTVYDVAVVGQGGFLGGAIATALRARGAHVEGFTREDPLILPASTPVDGRASDPAGNSAANPAANPAATWSPRADAVTEVVWAAGGITPAIAHARPDLIANALREFDRLLEAARAREVGTRIVLLSSGGAVYGRPAHPPYREDTDVHPANAYGAFKASQERRLQESGLAHAVVRISNAYGPGQVGAGEQGVLAMWMRAIAAGRPVAMRGDGETERDFVYVDDVAELVCRVVERPDAPALINAGSGQPTRLSSLVDLVEYVVAPLPVHIDRQAAQASDAPSTWLDVTRAREALGWEASVPLAQGIARMWDGFARA